MKRVSGRVWDVPVCRTCKSLKKFTKKHKYRIDNFYYCKHYARTLPSWCAPEKIPDFCDNKHDPKGKTK